MNALSAYKKLHRLAPTFSTRDASMILNVSAKYASVILTRLAKNQMIVHLGRGLWAYSDNIDPLLLPTLFAHPWSCYVSLYSALYFHGMITQIPTAVYAITIGKTKRYKTPFGLVSLHHMNADLFDGYKAYGPQAIYMATPEKALFDTLYLAPAKSLLFASLTEIELPKHFNKAQFKQWAAGIQNKSRRAHVLSFLPRYQTG